MLIPYHVDVPQDRRPLMNWAVIAVTIGMFFVTIEPLNDSVLEAISKDTEWIPSYSFPDILVAYGFRPIGMIGCILLHADIFHLLGNMLFLWIFGNAICAKVGNKFYLPLYILLAFISSLLPAIFSTTPGVGASGAINGLVGLYLVLFPLNEISCLFFIMLFFRPIGKIITLSSFWIILYWLAFDIGGLVLTPESGTGYLAHLGGFAGGFALGLIFLKTKLIKMESYEKSLLHVFKHGANSDGPQMEISEDIDNILKSRGVRTPSKIAVKATPTVPAISKKSSKPTQPQIKQQVVKGYVIEDVPDTPFYAIDQNDPSRESWVFNVPDPKLTNETLVRNGLIYFNCACGKRVKMPVSFAGKKGRCPQCNNVIHIPKLTV